MKEWTDGYGICAKRDKGTIKDGIVSMTFIIYSDISRFPILVATKYSAKGIREKFDPLEVSYYYHWHGTGHVELQPLLRDTAEFAFKIKRA